MDEMTQLRELRADAPTPDRARLVPGRERLLQGAGKRTRLHGAARRRLTVIGAAAAVTVAALVTAQLPDGGGRGAAPPASLQDGDAPTRADEARTVLRKAARAAEAQPDPEPSTGQWVYVKRFYGHEDSPGDREVPSQGTQEGWYPWRELEKGWQPDDVYSYRERYAILRKLPAEPQKWFTEALAWLPPPKDEKGAEQQRYWVAENLLGTPLAPPDGLAKLYRALAEIDGMRVVDHLVTDATGDKAIALYLDDGGRTRDELLIDPHTYRYVGQRMVYVKDAKPVPGHPDLPQYEAGDVAANGALVEVALVDREGRRP